MLPSKRSRTETQSFRVMGFQLQRGAAVKGRLLSSRSTRSANNQVSLAFGSTASRGGRSHFLETITTRLLQAGRVAMFDKMIRTKTTKTYEEKKDGGARLELTLNGSKTLSFDCGTEIRAMGLCTA